MLLTATGCCAIIALAISACYLWHQLRTFPVARRIINLLMPLSQISLVACAYAMRPFSEFGDAIALLAATTGIVCACLNPLFFRSLLAAERAEAEAERANLLESQVTAQEQYTLLMQRTRDEAELVRRELDHELAAIEGALAVNDLEAAREHLDGAVHTVRAPKMPPCRHPVVAAILSAKAAWCSEQGIDLHIDAEVPDDISTPDVELCALFANALDNAIHASGSVEDGARWIRVSAHPVQGYFLLEVENSCAAGGDAASQEVASPWKEDPSGPQAGTLPRHGLGLHIMREIVERHDGNLAITKTDGSFLISALWKR